MMLTIDIGDTFYVPTGGKIHLYIVTIMIENNRYMLFNTTTSHKINTEQDCIINPGKGIPSFITKTSTIDYKYPRIYRVNEIEREMQNGNFKYGGKFLELYIIDEIITKGMSSKKIPKKFKEVLVDAVQKQKIGA